MDRDLAMVVGLFSKGEGDSQKKYNLVKKFYQAFKVSLNIQKSNQIIWDQQCPPTVQQE